MSSSAVVGGDDNESHHQSAADELLLPEDDDNSNNNKRRKTTSSNTTTALPTWYEKHVRLPDQFDYASEKAEPPDDDGTTGDRVVSLDDPDKTMSYHTELWNLFKEIPTRNVIEKAKVVTTAAGAGFVNNFCWPNVTKVYQEIHDGKNSQMDAHAMSRLRLNDCHDRPPTVLRKTPDRKSICGTIRFECWRCRPRRGPQPDPNRMVLEFLGSQTLLDFHNAIVELTNDELGKEQQEERVKQHSKQVADASTVAGSVEQQQQDVLMSSGFFFVEGRFYTAGNVDYTSTIVEWLCSGGERERHNRLQHLGLTKTHNPEVTAMSATRLDDIALRLGFRYIHVHHGDVECSVFATDRRLLSTEETRVDQFPILHDILTPLGSTDCEACSRRCATVVTSTYCQITGGHRTLCEDCCCQLDLPSRARDEIKRYSIWRSEEEMSPSTTKGGASAKF